MMSKKAVRKRSTIVAILLIVASATVGTADAEDGRGSGSFPASLGSGTSWREAMPAERRSYILGITDGLRLAAVFDRAEVDLGPVAQCVQLMGGERLARVVGAGLDARAIEQDELALPFHVWDALVSTCLDRPRPQETEPVRQGD